MLSYTAIVKQAYHVTVANQILWPFGLLAVGSFNLNFLHFQNLPIRENDLLARSVDMVQTLQQHPGYLALISLTVLVIALGGLLATNFARSALILLGQQALKQKLNVRAQSKLALKRIWPVIKISLFTSSLMILVGTALVGPAFLFNLTGDSKLLVLEVGALVFLGMVFVISCLNIFTTFYAVVYGQDFSRSLKLGVDLVAARWPQILALVAVLTVLYCGSFVLGVSLIFIARLGFRFLLLFLEQFHILSFSAMIVVLKFFSNLLFWYLLAGLSVFFNQALLILFLELNDPLEADAAKASLPAAAAMTS